MDQTETDTLVTRLGFRFFLRPVTQRDEALLTGFFGQVTPEDLRFRFLGSVGATDHGRLAAIAAVQDERTDSFLALDEGGAVIATAVLAGDAAGERGEVAIAVRAEDKGRGIGWTLLDYLVGIARERGYSSVESIEDRENHAAITLEREMGFTVEPFGGDPALVTVRRRLR